MTKEYSKLVASTRPNSALGSAMGDKSREPSPYGFTAMTRPARARVVKDIVTPRTPQELHDLWGRTLDPKFTASTLAWLAKASREEKQHFKIAIASHPTQKISQSRLGFVAKDGPFAASNPYSRSVTPSHGFRRPPRPQSAPLTRPGTAESRRRINPFRAPARFEDEENECPREEYRCQINLLYVWCFSGSDVASNVNV